MNEVTIWSYTNNSGRNIRVESALSNEQAIEICSKLPSEFARELVAKSGRLSYNQWVWVHKLAVESLTPKQEVVALNDLSAVVALFDSARQSGLKRPIIRLRVANTPVRIKQAGADSRNAGCLYITGEDFDTYYGKVSAEGVFTPARSCSEAITNLLREFAADPVRVAAEYGQVTGDCCFCGKELKDDRSVSAGFGPVCAKKFNLPY